MKKHLNIWMNGHYVGYWLIKNGIDELQYDPSWVASELGRALSLSLPFTPGNQKIKGDAVKFYFDNLLPDNIQIRERIATRFNKKDTNHFTLLSEIGRDCIGAIQLLPPLEKPFKIKSIESNPLTRSQIAEILKNTINSDFIENNDETFRISLAGTQEKTALLWYKKCWQYPRGSTPTTHIFKLPLSVENTRLLNLKLSVENEWLCSKIFEAFNIPIAHCVMDSFDGQKVLIVERFDRQFSTNGSWVKRLPQEDFCQAKGISPLYKYQSDGGLSIKDCMTILDGSENANQDKEIFFKIQIIFYLLLATDGHSKNFSLRILSKDRYTLAPIYDVISFHPMVGKKSNQVAYQKVKLAMAVKSNKNHYVANTIQYRHYISQAMKVGIGSRVASSLIEQVLSNTGSVIEKVKQELPKDFPTIISNSIFTGLKNQTKKLANTARS